LIASDRIGRDQAWISMSLVLFGVP